MNNHDGWMSGWMSSYGMWPWAVIAVLIIVLLVVAISKIAKK